MSEVGPTRPWSLQCGKRLLIREPVHDQPLWPLVSPDGATPWISALLAMETGAGSYRMLSTKALHHFTPFHDTHKCINYMCGNR